MREREKCVHFDMCVCRFFWCLFSWLSFLPLPFVCWLAFVVVVVDRLISYTNLHVEIIVNHMFYEHQHLVCLWWRKKSFHTIHSCLSFSLLSFLSFFFVIVYLSPLVWIEDNVLFYYSDSTIWKWSLNYLFYYLFGYKYTFVVVIICGYGRCVACVCAKWKQFQF